MDAALHARRALESLLSCLAGPADQAGAVDYRDVSDYGSFDASRCADLRKPSSRPTAVQLIRCLAIDLQARPVADIGGPDLAEFKACQLGRGHNGGGVTTVDLCMTSDNVVAGP